MCSHARPIKSDSDVGKVVVVTADIDSNMDVAAEKRQAQLLHTEVRINQFQN